jgi:hypothetical protein
MTPIEPTEPTEPEPTEPGPEGEPEPATVADAIETGAYI